MVIYLVVDNDGTDSKEFFDGIFDSERSLLAYYYSRLLLCGLMHNLNNIKGLGGNFRKNRLDLQADDTEYHKAPIPAMTSAAKLGQLPTYGAISLRVS
jgi:hypothetical protein